MSRPPFSIPLFALAYKVSPVEKVIELLEKLEVKVQEEGKAEAAAYDKFACFCKEQADEKLYAKEKSVKLIAELDAKIAELGAEITKLNGEISELGKKIQATTKEIEGLTLDREKTHETYVAAEADMASAIAAVEGALKALANAKGGMAGKTDQNALLQVQKAAALAVALVQEDAKSALGQKRMSILEKLAQPGSGEADQYSFHSNDIISLLEDLKDKFTANKNELDQAEFESKAEFDSKIVDLENEKQFDEKDNQGELLV